MARIQPENTTPERLLCEALRSQNLHFEEHPRLGRIRPDLSFPTERVVVFVDGCFWHGCPDHYVRPRTREEFWAGKLAGNVERDRRQTLALEDQGWKVVRLWECEVRDDPARRAEDIQLAMVPVVAEHSPRWVVERVEILDPSGGLEKRHIVDLRNPGSRMEVERRRTTCKKGRGEPVG